MTQDEIMNMARQCGASIFVTKDGASVGLTSPNKIEAFYKMAVAKEQARCCSIVYGMAGSDNVAQRTVDAIRGKK